MVGSCGELALATYGVELSLVVPVYNERDNVSPLWEAVRLTSPLFDCFGVRWLRRRYVGSVTGKEIDG